MYYHPQDPNLFYPAQDYPAQDPRQFQVPGFPGGGGGQADRRLDRLERQVERIDRRLDQLDRRMDRVERRLGIGGGRENW